jgi:AAA domain, putative AbiEii toxin, Type IV TA system/AAA domain
MYIDHLTLENFRCFAKQSVEFMHTDSPQAVGAKFPNVNVVLGANGVGKTTLLKAVALTSLNPLIGQSGFRPSSLIRRKASGISINETEAKVRGSLTSKFANYELDDGRKIPVRDVTPVNLEILPLNEEVVFVKQPAWLNTPDLEVGKSLSISSYFAVAYGAMRRVERLPSYELEAQNRQYSYRYSRMANLFDSRVVLTPLVTWLPQLPKREKKQILELFASLMPAKLEYTDTIDGREFSFLHNGIRVPFDALADGHRSYIGWISDLLYHLHRANPKNVQDVHGVVLVDEVDLLAHPTWQRTLVPQLSKTFPKLQFILTTHSPIVAASVEAANLLILEPGRNGTAKLRRPDAEVYGLNAQQVLHEVFGMDSTRAVGFEQHLNKLAKRSRAGDRAAARELTQGLAFGAGKPPEPEDEADLNAIQKAAQDLLETQP